MNEITKKILKKYSNSDKNIKENYPKIRKIQQFIAPNTERNNRITDETLPVGEGIPLKLFEPDEIRSDEIIIYFHGGGWVVGSPEYFAMAALNISRFTGRRVLSADYRLAPENPFPAGLNDCMMTVIAVMDGLILKEYSPEQIILLGDSAGGNLCAAVSLYRRDKKMSPLKAQILYYPATYWDHGPDSPFDSIRDNGYDYGLTSKNVEDYFSLYVSNEKDKKCPYAAPLMAEDFSNQPPTLIITSEFDPLRDEGEEYGKKLLEAGNKVRIVRIKNTIHGFINFSPLYSPVRNSLIMVNDFLECLN